VVEGARLESVYTETYRGFERRVAPQTHVVQVRPAGVSTQCESIPTGVDEEAISKRIKQIW